MFKYLIVLSDNGIGDVMVVTLDKPIHELYEVTDYGETFIVYDNQKIFFYVESVLTLEEIIEMFK